MSKSQGPVLIDLDAQPVSSDAQTPATAPAVPDIIDGPNGQAMQTVIALGAREPNRLARWFWRLLFALFSFGLSVWAWGAVTALIDRNIYLGYVALGLTALLLIVCLGIILREWAAFSRLRRLDDVHNSAVSALASNDLSASRKVTDQLLSLYRGRDELKWACEKVSDRRSEILDADGLLGLVEVEVLKPIDDAAQREIEAAARQVATVTALVPLALADVFVALASNLRMIRRVAELYGGRAGTLGSWRLTRTVLGHLVATGAVSVGDDLIGSLAGGGVLSKVSRRFGEGVINGALTARVGVAAIEVCRPLPFTREKRPAVTKLVQRALTGLFGAGKG